jgi:hypothetical protein
METNIYGLEAEPSLALYHGLIDFALECCPLALLVLRPELELAEAGQELLGSAVELELNTDLFSVGSFIVEGIYVQLAPR